MHAWYVGDVHENKIKLHTLQKVNYLCSAFVL